MGNFRPVKLKRQGPQPLSELLGLFVKSNGLQPQLYRQAVFDAWDKVSGAASYTSNKFLKDNILYITISSSVARNALLCRRGQILQQINDIVAADSLLSSCGEVPRIEQIRLR